MSFPFGEMPDPISQIAQNAAGIWETDRQWERQKYQMRQQRQFAKMGIRWRVEDAAAAGINPLAALGLPTHSFTPQHVGKANLKTMGQNIRMPVQRNVTPYERKIQELQVKKAQLEIDRLGLENLGLANELREAQKPPTMPVEGDMGLPGQGTVEVQLSDGSWANAGQNSPYVEPERPRQQKIGVEKNIAARSIAHIGPQGYLWYDPSQSASEGVTEGPGQIAFYGQKWAKGIRDILVHKVPSTNKAFNDRKRLRYERSKLQKPPAGMEWHWDVRGQWRLENKNGLFYTNRWTRWKQYRNYRY